MVFPAYLSTATVQPPRLSEQALLSLLKGPGAPAEDHIPFPRFGAAGLIGAPPGLELPPSPRKTPQRGSQRKGRAARPAPGSEQTESPAGYPGSPQKGRSVAPAFVDVGGLSSWAPPRTFSTLTADTLSTVYTTSAACSDSEPPSPVRPPAQRFAAPSQASHATLIDAFRQLQHRDAATVLKLRKLQSLPDGAATELVGQYFSRFGTVEEIHLVCSQTKAAKRGAARPRPSGLGFLVMRSADAAEAILSLGSEHGVGGFPIQVERFERARAP